MRDWRQSDRFRWWLAAGLFVVLMLSSGLGFYNLSVYMNLLASERGISVANASSAVGLFFLAGGVAGLAVGRFIQTHDVRLVLVAGALSGGAALGCIGYVRDVWQLFLVYAVFGAGNACVSLIPATTLITRWFDERRRAIALSFASTGLSLGGVVLTPMSVALFAEAPLERAMPLLGLVYFAGITPIAWLLVRSWPVAVRAEEGTLQPSTEYGHAVRTRFFLLLTLAYVLVMGAQVGAIAHLYNRGVEIAERLEASLAVAVLASASIVGRLLGGVLVSRLPLAGFTLANVAGQVLGLLAVGFAHDARELWLGAALFGFTVGNLLMLQPLLLAAAYGVAHYARIFAASQAVTTLGIAAGPAVMGWIFEHGGYRMSFVSFAAASSVAFVVLLAAGSPPRARVAEAELAPVPATPRQGFGESAERSTC